MALYAFDELDPEDDLDSNVREFFLAYDDPSKNDDPDAEVGSLYLRGFSSKRTSVIGSKVAEAFALGGHRRIRQALERLENNIAAGDTNVDIVGFGRSAALAVSFANEIAARHPGVSIRFVGLFDAVTSFEASGNRVDAGFDLKLPPNAGTVVLAVTRDEMREHAARSGVPITPPVMPAASEPTETQWMLHPPLESSPTVMKEVYRTPHMDFSAQEPLVPGTVFTVIVSADTDAPRDGEASMAIAATVPASTTELNLEAWISGTPHFTFPALRVKPFVISLTESLLPTVEFEVAVVDPVPAAHAELIVYFLNDGRPCGYVSRRASIVTHAHAAPPDAAVSGRMPKPVLLAEIGAKRPDLTIEITARRKQLECRVSSPLLPALAAASPVEWPLPTDTRTLVAGLMQEFVNTDVSNKARLLSLRGAGIQLWESAPEEVKDAFWALLDAGHPIRTIFIVSEEPYVPWELMIPHRVRDGRSEFREPLGVEFAVGRWVPLDHISPPQEVSLARCVIVAPNYPGPAPGKLAHAAGEAAYVKSKFGGEILKPADIENFDAVLNFDFGLLHVICHGADSGEIGNQKIYLEDGELSSNQVKGMDAFQHGLMKKPLVFLNACEIGRPTAALVGIGGFAEAFIKAGASAVIAPLWSIKDVIAPEVAREFYDTISADPTVPFAQVMQRVRAKAYAAGGGEDTYAAYCYYGDPSAACRVTTPVGT